MYYDERNNYFDYTKTEDKDYLSLDLDKINIFNLRPDEKVELMDPVEGFNKGNLFYNLYDPYKNHSYTVRVSGERNRLLLNIQILDFAMNDLNLYLDLFPQDTKCINVFNEYRRKYDEYKNMFEKKYGPLTVGGVNYDGEFTWIKNPWPWDKGGSA